jgi:hypothetical protein
MHNQPFCKVASAILIALLVPLLAHAQAHEHTLHQFGGNCWVNQQNYTLVSALAVDSKGDLYGTRVCGRD